MDRSKRTASFVILLLLLGALFLIGIMPKSPSGSQRAEGASQPPDSGSEQSTVLEQPTFSVTNNNVVYYGAISSDVGVAILNVQSGKLLMGDLGMEQADGKFISVSVAISNRQNTAITMDPNLFEILDSNGNVYSTSEKSMDVPTGSNLFLAQINPGIIKIGQIIFDVPQSLNLDDLQLRFSGGMTGDSAVLPLKVNSKTNEPPKPDAATAPIPAPVPDLSGSTSGTAPTPTESENAAMPTPTSLTPAASTMSAPQLTNANVPDTSTASSSNNMPGEEQNAVAYNPGGEVAAPQIISAVRANYTQQAIDAKLDGIVVVGLTVDIYGNPQSIHVVKPLGLGLDECAVAAVKQYRFKPGTFHGNPVPVSINVDIVFNRFFAGLKTSSSSAPIQ